MSQNKIYVGSLAYEVTGGDLEAHFRQFGDIAEVKLITDRETGRSRGFAFITFANPAGAQASLAADGAELKGKKMRVNMAREDDRRRAGGGGGGRPPRQSQGGHRGDRDRW